GITFHVADPDRVADPRPARGDERGVRARFVFGDGWYVGLAPVPNEKVNVGIVVPTKRLNAGVGPVVAGVLRSIPEQAGRWLSVPQTDKPQVRGQLEHHTSRAAGPGWLLVGDAIEFIDPLTGEGLHRALSTAELAADAISANLSGDRGA